MTCNKIPHQILKSHFDILRDKNPGYSLRAFARDLDVSVSFASALLSGKKPVPPARFEQICRVLRIDELGRLALQEAGFIMPAPKPQPAQALTSDNESDRGYVLQSQRKYELLSEWYILPLLDLTTCADFRPDIPWVARRLRISIHEVNKALSILKRLGAMTMEDGRWTKVAKKLRFPTVASHPAIRKFHQSMLQKAIQVLDKCTTADDFSSRLISAITVAGNPQNLERARAHVHRALYEAAEILAQGPCTEVYQINMQLFPLSGPIENQTGKMNSTAATPNLTAGRANKP